MRKFFCIVLLLILSQTSFSLPLLFKKKTRLETDDNRLIANYDTSKLKTLRIGVAFNGVVNNLGNFVKVFAEEENPIFLGALTINEYNLSDSKVFDSPPAKIFVTAKNAGDYIVCIWGE